MSVSVTLMSLSGQVNMKVDAFTVTRVTGNMKSVNWVKNKQGWKHLKGIKFAVPSKRVIVDMLIEIDHPDLHYSIKDVKGEPGEPIARLTTLGWTCKENLLMTRGLFGIKIITLGHISVKRMVSLRRLIST